MLLILTNPQLNRLKPEIKNGAEVLINLSFIMIGDTHDETNFSQNLLLTDA